MRISVIVRTYNESLYLAKLLLGIQKQEIPQGTEVEIVLVDSGSTDNTVSIAQDSGCRIVGIAKEEFSFGRSLNLGCETATGEILVFISGHCIPVDQNWLWNLVKPVSDGNVVWTYGRQVGIQQSRYSEIRIFEKYYPPVSAIPQQGFFCNNANAALLRTVWNENRFNEELTGLEDMHLAQLIVNKGMKLGYVSDAAVFHIHNENWRKIKNRFEREAIALQYIMPEVQINFTDFIRYFFSSVVLDYGEAIREGVFFKCGKEILFYRFAQYWGSYRGNHLHRKISRKTKENYFYPR